MIKENKAGIQKDMYINVHSSIIHYNQKVEMTQQSLTDDRINKMWAISSMEYDSVIKRNKVLIHATDMEEF